MKLSTQILIGFFIAISIDLLDSYVNYSLTLQVKTNMGFLSNSEAIIRNSGMLNKRIVDMQSAFRGYLLTDDDRFLLPYKDGLRSIPEIIAQEKKLTPASSNQRLKLDSIAALHAAWINYAGSLIRSKKKISGAASAKSYQKLFDSEFRRQTGKNYNDRITGIFRSFDEYEYKVREDRRKALAASIKKTETSSLLFSSLLVIVGSTIATYLVRKISFRISSMVALADNISRGNFTAVTDNRKDELSSLSVSLNSMSATLSRNIADLEKKNYELNQFAYVVSHDLKAPIRGINNVVHWIKEDHNQEISVDMRKYLDIILDRLRRMGSLIDGLLRFARVSSQNSVKENVDVNLLINEVAEIIVPKGWEITVNNLPNIITEKLLLEQVFSNLLDNAVKFASNEHAKINITCKEKPDHYEFTVTDNGPGIEKQYQDKIFEIFQTLRERNDKESTGIGLAIVKKIIEDKQCTISVISAVPQGASFIFTWPKSEHYEQENSAN